MHEALLSKLANAHDPAARQRAFDEARASQENLGLQAVSLAGLDLSGLDLLGIEMERVTLRGAACQGTRFSRLFDCNLDCIDATDSSLPHLHQCQLSGARLNGAEMGGGIYGCDFTRSSLCLARIGPVQPNHRVESGDSCFDEADLHGVDAAGAYLPRSSFRNARLTQARLSRADLSGCDLRGADLTGANIARTCLANAVTTGAVFDECAMTIEQAEDLRRSCQRTIMRPRIISHNAGPQIGTLTQELQAIGDYRIGWHFRPLAPHRAQKIMITDRLSSGVLTGYAFDVETECFVRMYPMDVGNWTLPVILLDIAADYANWEVDSKSLKVRLNRPGKEKWILELLRQSLAELFAFGW